MRDITESLLTEVCHKLKSSLIQSYSHAGVSLFHHSSNTEDGACLLEHYNVWVPLR